MARLYSSPARVTILFACFLVFLFTFSAAGQRIEPASDILLPWFDVDLVDPDLGRDTHFTVANAASGSVNVEVTVYTNWGIPVLVVDTAIARGETRTWEFARWIVDGTLPDRQLSPAEIADLQAKLSGKPSSADRLFYGSELTPSHAVGYAIITSRNVPHSDALSGNLLAMVGGTNSFATDALPVLTHEWKGDATRHLLPLLEQAQSPAVETELVIWSGRRFEPSPTAEPVGPKSVAKLSLFGRSGNFIQELQLTVAAVRLLTLPEIAGSTPLGWVIVSTDAPSTVALRRYYIVSKGRLRGFRPPEGEVSVPALGLEKRVEGNVAREPAAAVGIPVGDTVAYTYEVSNGTGSVIRSISVTDDTGIAVSCPKSELQPGERMTCSARSIAVACLQSNVATASGDAGGQQLAATDRAYYFGLHRAAVAIEKRINGMDADEPPGPDLSVGATAHWTFLVTNAGETELRDLKVVDPTVPQVSCPSETLAPGMSMICAGTSIATTGAVDNVATVTATSPCDGRVSASDPAHYTGARAEAAIAIEKLVQGVEADAPPGPDVPAGSQLVWSFVVTNSGLVRLTEISVTDSQGLTVNCPKTALAPNESMTCTAPATVALPCQQTNRATASSRTTSGEVVSAEDDANYTGIASRAIALETRVNGDDADSVPGPTIDGLAVNFTYVVSNRGDVGLTAVGVNATDGVVPLCPKSVLAAGESMTCTATASSSSGAHEHSATASGTPPCGNVISATDSAFFTAVRASITIEKRVNGSDADTAPGIAVTIGSSLTWTFVVGNPGDVRLTSVVVEDADSRVSVACPKSVLEPGESMTCTTSATAAEPCTQETRATATGQSAIGPVSDGDNAFYTGTPVPAVTIETTVNSEEADASPGLPIVNGYALTFRYVVTNSGNVPLGPVQVTAESPAVVPDCPRAYLPAGESMTCIAGASATTLGQFQHIGRVSATPPCGDTLTANDSAFFNVLPNPQVDLEKIIVYGEGTEADADTPPGPSVKAGIVDWKYVVTNTGALDLASISVTDDHGPVTCPKTTLSAGESMTCLMPGVVEPCQNESHATVSATPPEAPAYPVSDSDALFVYSEPLRQIGFETLVNGFEADVPPGPVVKDGNAVLWTYVVTNTSNVAINGVSVVDDGYVAVTCPKSMLQPGESMTCSASSLAAHGPHANRGTVVAYLPCGDPLTSSDASNYVGAIPHLSLKKLVAGEDANTEPGPFLVAGDPVSFSYVVSNNGDVELTNVRVTDDQGLSVVCPKTTLSVEETMTCTADSTVIEGGYYNLGTAFGEALGETTSASDVAQYVGYVPRILIMKKTNGQTYVDPPGPTFLVGLPVQWTYTVVNITPLTLTEVSVTDDQGVAVVCPKSVLATGEQMTCNASGIATAGQYQNVGTVSGKAPAGPPAVAHDTSYYFGANPVITIEKRIAGQDADTAPGPQLTFGNLAAFTYEVRNVGNVTLHNVQVSDDSGLGVWCPTTQLTAGQSMTCTATTNVVLGLQTSVGTASGEGFDSPVIASDPANYTGVRAELGLDKKINGQHVDAAPGPELVAGTTASWTYVVTNLGDVLLTGVAVSDTRGVVVSCPKSTLQPAESMTCTGTSTVIAAPYSNLGTASGTPPDGMTVFKSDVSYYLGLQPQIFIDKLVNGQPGMPGPTLRTGDPVTFSYVVKNSGLVPLTNVAVDDNDPSLTVTCPKTELAIDESMTCTATGTVVWGGYVNVGTARAEASGVVVDNWMQAQYYGIYPAIAIDKLTNGKDGLDINAGEQVTWTYDVRNDGDVRLTEVGVTDDRGVAVTCPKTTLELYEAMTCTAFGTATAGPYSNTGTVSGKPSIGPPVTASDTSSYNGIAPPQGCSIDYWKTHVGAWPATGLSPTQTVLSVFNLTQNMPLIAQTPLLDALNFDGVDGIPMLAAAEVVLRSGVAAMLNASHPDINYPLTPSNTQIIVNSVIGSGNGPAMLEIAGVLDTYNNAACPLP